VKTYLPEQLVSDDAPVPDARVAYQYVLRHHVGGDLLFNGCDVDWKRTIAITREIILVDDDKSTSIDCETTETRRRRSF